MDEFEQREGESLFGYAQRRRNLPKDHCAHMAPQIFEQFIDAAIRRVKTQQQANIAALLNAAIGGDDLLI